MISDTLDGQLHQLRGALLWMPSHTTVDNFSGRIKSNNKAVTSVDWRANQLADLLAKKGAITSSDRDASTKRIATARAALLHHAAVLGMTTHAANNHKVSVTQADGTVCMKLLRDSSSLVRKSRAEAKPKTAAKGKTVEKRPAAASASTLINVNASDRALKTARLIKASKAVGVKSKIELNRLVKDIAENVKPRAAAANDGYSAAERLRLLRERILAKRPRAVEVDADCGATENLHIRRRLRVKTRTPESC